MLDISYVSKYYDQSIALENFSLVVEPGDIVGIFGENGAGKTTLLKAVMGLIKLNVGDITVDGKGNLGAFDLLSYITEEGSWFPDMTPEEHCEFYENLIDKFDSKKFHSLIGYFGVAPHKKAGSMSRGQSSKLEAAIGLSRGARYILMDEPFSGKDIFSRRDFLKMIAGSLNDEAVIIATHMPNEVSSLITRAVIMKEGRKLREVTMEELEKKHISLEDFIKEVYCYDEGKVNKFL